MPSLIFPRLRNTLIPVACGVSAILGAPNLPRLLPDEAYLVPALILIVACLSILFYRLLRGDPADRPAARLMAAAMVIAFGPGLILILVFSLIGESAYAGTATILSAFALPLLAALYAFAIYRDRFGHWELPAIQVLTLYSFALLYATAFALVYVIGSRLVPAFSPTLAFSLILSLVFVLAALPVYVAFRKMAERLLYGARIQPEGILRVFANQLPTATTRQAFADLLEREVTGPLLIRQSALILLSKEQSEVAYQSGVEIGASVLDEEEIHRLTASTGEYPRRVVTESPFGWVRLAVPVGTGGHVMALWLLGRRDPDDFYPQRDIRLLFTLGSELATPLESLRLVDESRRRAEEFEALYDVARDITTKEDLHSLLRTVVQRAISLVGAQVGGIFLFQEPGGELKLATAVGPAEEDQLAAMGGQGLGREALDLRAPVIVNEFDRASDGSLIAREHGVRAYVRCPILQEEELAGLLVVGRVNGAPGQFTSKDVRLLGLFATLASNMLRTAQLHDETRRRAEQLRLLYDAGLGLNSLLDPKEQLKLLFQSALQALHADEAEFFRYDAASGELKAETVLGIDPVYVAQWEELSFPERANAGPVGWVAARREAINLPNAPSFPGWVAVDPGVHSGIWAPIEREGRLLGVLGVTSNRGAAFSKQDVDLILLFANQAAVAMENARLFSETELRLQRMSSSRSIDTAITGSLDLRVTLNVLLDQVTTQLRMDAADVLLFNTHTQLLEFAAARGFRSRALQNTRLQVGKGLAGRAALEREIVHLSDLVGQPGELSKSPLLGSEDFVEYYGVPLIAKAQIKGVLEVFSRRRIEPDPEWMEFLETIAGQAAIAVDNAGLFDSLQRTNLDLTLAYDSTLDSLARALDLRNHEPEGHTLRVTELTLQISRVLGIGEADLVHLRRGALLHDLGHLGVPEAVLLKAGPLNEREWGLVRRHPVLAFELLSPIEFLGPALDIPYCHHEKWDGTGYPRGLVGEQIPIGARIFAVVDVWESLTSDRPFREAWSREQTRKYIWDKAGTHFDPSVVEIFLESVSKT
ncbi:MAG: GAF domain-containing protein [Anaerolineales bacterium]|jgi:GAF domain-containing protein